jgi:hypothetical protein
MPVVLIRRACCTGDCRLDCVGDDCQDLAMKRGEPQPTSSAISDEIARRNTDDAHAVRVERIRRDLALSPAERLDKLAALCRQADLLRSARRVP